MTFLELETELGDAYNAHYESSLRLRRSVNAVLAKPATSLDDVLLRRQLLMRIYEAGLISERENLLECTI
ncbi:hypothetical protein [Taklimakanibacter deserti]|uniref:hypothetical protein n=1 Tax=Taklimakanibacter deserti TaxID=2267839 RepID=UPI0013C4035E